MGRDNSQEADGPSGHFLERQRSMRWRGEAIIPLLISEPCTLQSYFHPHILKTSLQQGQETEALTGAMTCAKAQSGRAEMGGLTCPLPHPQATPWSLRSPTPAALIQCYREVEEDGRRSEGAGSLKPGRWVTLGSSRESMASGSSSV